ncbi:MAG: ImmA/IrrE family metallo-endopeptidase [Anaerolineales bacterium]
MIPVSREERHWFLENAARALLDFSGVSEPPVPVEQVLNHPPAVYQEDFGVVDMYSHLWDATFARPPGQRGSIFVRVDLEPEERRFALARETLCALITSKHGRDLGMPDLLMSELKDSAEYFATQYVAPESLVQAYRAQGGDEENFADSFQLPAGVAAARW